MLGNRESHDGMVLLNAEGNSVKHTILIAIVWHLNTFTFSIKEMAFQALFDPPNQLGATKKKHIHDTTR